LNFGRVSYSVFVSRFVTLLALREEEDEEDKDEEDEGRVESLRNMI